MDIQRLRPDGAEALSHHARMEKLVMPNSAKNLADQYPRWLARTTFVVRIMLAIAFVAAGCAKLAGVPAMVQVFEAIGLGQWFRLVTGAVEITGAILLVAPRTIGLGAALLTATMTGAVFTHIVLIGGNPNPAIVLLLLSAFILWERRGDVTRFLGSNQEATA
jgi:putative oxidoreductase